MNVRTIPLPFRMLGTHRAVPADVQPPRPHLAAARRLTQGIDDPRAAWERLVEAGLVPPAWAGTDRRVFRWISEAPLDATSRPSTCGFANADGGPSGEATYHVTDRSWPFTVDDAVAVAADVGAIEEAEAHAFELCRRTEAWGSPTPARVAWRGLARDAETPRSPGRDVFYALRIFVEAALDDAGQTVPSSEPGDVSWARACASGLRVPRQVEDPHYLYPPSGPPQPPAELGGVPFADLPDPWQSLREMERRHVRLDAITGDALVLLFLPP